ncbi:hypothetical protein ACHQM5_030683 [Ranunculus cassubicifolius]
MKLEGSFNSPAPVEAMTQSPWKSPIPYLFGGLAAMLFLIACALLILACSYWKRNQQNGGGHGDDRDLEKGEESIKVAHHVFEEKIVVIMAGDRNPTYLATPFPATIGKAAAFNNSPNDDTEEACFSDMIDKSPKHEEATATAIAINHHLDEHEEASDHNN